MEQLMNVYSEHYKTRPITVGKKLRYDNGDPSVHLGGVVYARFYCMDLRDENGVSLKESDFDCSDKNK